MNTITSSSDSGTMNAMTSGDSGSESLEEEEDLPMPMQNISQRLSARRTLLQKRLTLTHKENQQLIPLETTTRLSRTAQNRQTSIEHPMMADAIRKLRLGGMKSNEVKGRLKFTVSKGNVLRLPPSNGEESSRDVAAAIKVTLCRRFEDLHPSRKEDDAAYLDAVENDKETTIITNLPPNYESGGWRCHAKIESTTDDQDVSVECLHPNRPQDKMCTKCTSPRPDIRQEFAYLRLLAPAIRKQRKEYERIIHSCDTELCRCEATERDATQRIEEGNEDDEGTFMLDVDLVSSGVFQRIDACSLLPMLVSRKSELSKRLVSARVELSIMIQSTYELACIHAQRVTRRFLVRCRLDDIRKQVYDAARIAASVEIQRIIRSKLAFIETERRRTLRDHRMATKLQSLVRMKFAIKERQRLYSIYITQLRHRSATTIQSLYRCHASKVRAQLLAEERKRQQEEEEKARVASTEKDSAIIIQKHARRLMSIEIVKNRKIELGLHQRLLMYLERYVVDGCLFSFVKSINDDYLRYERTIRTTIEREETMAMSFVQQVINTRDNDHSSAWDRYRNDQRLQDGKKKPPPNRIGQNPRINNKQHSSAMQIYGRSSKQQSSSKKNETNKAKSRDDQFERPNVKTSSSESHHDVSHTIETSMEENQTGQSIVESPSKFDRLRGQYLRFDIPNGLDDTVSNFLTAVALRVNFDSPGESSLHNSSFELQSAAAKKDQHKKCSAFVDPLLQRIHSKGIVFIRQLLPAENLASTLLDLGVSSEFIQLSISMLNVLSQIHGGNHLNRKQLMAKCRNLLDTQQQLRVNGESDVDEEAKTDRDNFNLVSFLGECGSASAEDFDDTDNPGGLWKSTTADTPTQEACIQPPSRTTVPSHNLAGSSRSSSSWVSKYTERVISQNETTNPALGMYRSGKLLDRQHSKTG